MSNRHEPDVEYLQSESMQRAPFSEAVRVGNLLYLSGQIGIDASGKLVGGGIEDETRQVLKNIKTTLERYGSSLDRIVKVTVMMADMEEWKVMNKIYVSHFDKNLPARSAFGTTGLALGARIEIECTAVVK